MNFLTPDETEQLKDSYARLAPVKGYLANTFYRRLFAMAPQARPLFPDDLSEQMDKFASMVDLLMENLDEPWFFMGKVKRLAKRHVRYGAQPEHYVIVGQALIQALEELTPGGLSLQERTLWEQLYNFLSDTMIEAAHPKAS